MATRLKKASVMEDMTAGTLTWTFPAIGKTSVVNVRDLSAEIRERATFHGLQQKLSDCYAGETDVKDAYAAHVEVYEMLKNGDWAAKREGGAVAPSLIGEAIERFIVANYPAEKHEAARAKCSDPEMRKKLRETDQIRKLVADIQAERAAKAASEKTGVSAAELLAV